MVLLQQQVEKNGANGWTSVSKGANWPQSSVVTAKNIGANEWTNSWTVPTTSKEPPSTSATTVALPVEQPTKKEQEIEPIPSDSAPSALSWVQKDSVPNPWLPQVPTDQAAIKKVSKEVKPTIEEELSKQSLYKTELCRSFSETGVCRYGHKCQFAHGEHELRAILRHPKYKTEFCKRFATTGNCPYGSRCRFIHPGANGNWSTSWTDDDEDNENDEALSENLQELSIKQESQTQQPQPQAQPQQQQQQQQLEDADEPPRRLAIFQNLTKVN